MSKQKSTSKNNIQKKSNSTNSFSWMIWVIGICSFLVFANTLGHGFVLDDIAVIQENKIVKQGFGGIKDILTTFYWQGYWNTNGGLYRPLSLIFFAIEWQIMPNTPFIHHFFNVFFYVCSTILLFVILKHFLKNYTSWIPFFITLCFAVHPIHTEVVANIKSRDEILCLLFFLITVYSFFCRKERIYVFIGFFSFVACLLSKEAGVLFLPILGILFWNLQKSFGFVLKRMFPFVLITVAWLAWHQHIINSSPFQKIKYTYLDNSLVNSPDAVTQVATGFSILGRYIVNTVLPFNLSYDYSFNQIPCVGIFSLPFLGSLILIGFVMSIAVFYRKKNTFITFGIIFFFITILLATNIFTLIGTTMGDRLLYTPVLGICIAIVFLFFDAFNILQLNSKRHPLIYFFLGITMFFFLASFERNKAWKSNFTLFTTDIQHASNSARVNFNYATAYFNNLPENFEDQQTQLPSIIAFYKKGLAIDPNDKNILVNLGVCYYRIKDYENALVCTLKAKEIDPNDYTLEGNLADIFFMKKEYEKAIFHYKNAIAHNKKQFNTYNFYGVALFNLKRYPEAIAIFEEGIIKQPEHAELWLNYGNSLAVSGHFKEAIKVFEKAYALNPEQKQSLNCLSMAYQALGNNEKAIYYRNQFLKK